MYLWGLTILLIPLAIHFLRRHQTIKLNFSSIRFLKNKAVSASRTKKIKNILLLLTRLLIIICLILIFAQPYKKTNPFTVIGGSNTAIYCWIDPTISMEYTHNKQTLWQQALVMTGIIDSVLPQIAKLYVYNEQLDDFNDFRKSDFNENNHGAITPVRHGQSDFLPMIQRFQEKSKSELFTPILVLFSDFQKKNQMDFEEYLTQSKPNLPILCISMSHSTPWNYSISNTSVSPQNSSVLKSHIKTKGRALSAQEIVAIVNSMRVGQEYITLKNNDSATVSLKISLNNSECRGSVQLPQKDPFYYDNIAYFNKRNTKKVSILIISKDKAAFPINAALKSLSSEEWGLINIKNPMSVTFQDIDSSGIIFLSGLTEPTEVISTLWSPNTHKNKLICFAPDLDESSNILTNTIFAYLKNKKAIHIKKSTKPLYPVLPDTISSLWQQFPRFSDKDVSIYSYLSTIPGNTILKLNNGSSLAASLTKHNNCTWIIFSTSIGITQTNNLCETGFYTPLLDRIVRFGLSSIVRDIPTWFAGVSVPNPYSNSEISAKIFDNNGTLVSIWNRQKYTSIEQPGIYKIVPNTMPAYWIAVNSDTSECNLTYSHPKIPVDKKTTIKFLTPQSFKSFLENNNTLGYELLWILLAFCLFIEVFFWKKKYGST